MTKKPTNWTHVKLSAMSILGFSTTFSFIIYLGYIYIYIYEDVVSLPLKREVMEVKEIIVEERRSTMLWMVAINGFSLIYN